MLKAFLILLNVNFVVIEGKVAVCNCFIIREGLVTELCCVLLVNNLVPHIVNFAVTQGCSYYRKIRQGQVRK